MRVSRIGIKKNWNNNNKQKYRMISEFLFSLIVMEETCMQLCAVSREADCYWIFTSRCHESNFNREFCTASGGVTMDNERTHNSIFVMVGSISHCITMMHEHGHGQHCLWTFVYGGHQIIERFKNKNWFDRTKTKQKMAYLLYLSSNRMNINQFLRNTYE